MLSILLILFTSVFFTGIILKTKSLTSGRIGPGLMQPVKDVIRLFRKGTIYSEYHKCYFQNITGNIFFNGTYGLSGDSFWFI